MKTPKYFMAISLLFISLFTLNAKSIVGKITYMEGNVEILRGDQTLAPQAVHIDGMIYEFDTVIVGNNGYMEVEMNTPSAGSLIKVHANTVFYFEASSKKSSLLRTLFQLLKGSLGFKVGRLGSNESFDIEIDNALMSVRGTEFFVDMALDRTILVTVSEGRVESKAGMNRISAEPGTATFIDSRSKLNALALEPEDINLYRQYWQGLRLNALKINADLSIEHYGQQWQMILPRMISAMEELALHEEIFRKWQQIASGERNHPGTADAIRDKRLISRGILELRASLPVTERVFYTLVGLEEVYRDGYMKTRYASDFYQDFQYEKQSIQGMLSKGRQFLMLYNQFFL